MKTINVIKQTKRKVLLPQIITAKARERIAALQRKKRIGNRKQA